MRQLTTSDAPVPDPHHDLLGMAGDAERLAAFIRGVELPFTLVRRSAREELPEA